MPVKKGYQETHMVVFMEIAEQMNGSQAVDAKGKDEENKCWRTSNSDNETVSTAELANLPFKISPWQVYCYEDFTLTNLASGFFGDIYKAEHVVTKEIMCLKAVKAEHAEDDADQSYREIAILQRLSHPNLLRFKGICLQDSQVHLLTEFINGGNLEELLMNHDETLFWSERLYIAQDIAKGLAYLHKSRIIHRDLASKNCLIRRMNEWKYAVVADLGLAIEIPKEGRLQVVGSPYNMAPEMMRGEPYDERADVFSYGIILCEIIARVQADPDELPRTNKFGLDVDKFQNMVGDCPLEFLQVAICCCQLDPHARPEFAAVVKILDLLFSSHTRPPLLEACADQELIISPRSRNCLTTETEHKNNNNHCNDVDAKHKISNNAPAIVVSQEQNSCHNQPISKKRTSSFIGRYKLFHSATDDLLKTTPGKLMSFFNNVLHFREMHIHVRRKKKSKDEKKRQSCTESKRRSINPDDSEDVLALSWNSYESGSETSSLSPSHQGKTSLDHVDGYLKSPPPFSTSENCDLAISTHLFHTIEPDNTSPRGNISDSESDPFSYSSSVTDLPRVFENDAQSTSSSIHSRSSTDGDLTDPDTDKTVRRHSSPLHVFEQLRNLRLEKRSATYLVSDAQTPGSGGHFETPHSRGGSESKVKRARSPFSFWARKTSKAKTDE